MSEARVDILDAVTGDVVEHCYGPMAGGRCPYPGTDGIVPCHGHRVAPLAAGPEFWKVWVPPATQHCPQAWSLDSVGY
jgi:hypothetical protein